MKKLGNTSLSFPIYSCMNDIIAKSFKTVRKIQGLKHILQQRRLNLNLVMPDWSQIMISEIMSRRKLDFRPYRLILKYFSYDLTMRF